MNGADAGAPQERAGTSVLQAVLDAIKGTLDPHSQIADHPNVKFAQMQRLRWMEAARANHQIDVDKLRAYLHGMAGVEAFHRGIDVTCGVLAEQLMELAPAAHQERTETPTEGRFRKKPVVIEAWLFDGSYESYAAIPSGGMARWFSAGLSGRPPCIEIQTLEGTMTAMPGDYIIKGIKGEFYPCKPDIFAATYEPEGAPAPAAHQETPDHESTHDAVRRNVDALSRGPQVDGSRSRAADGHQSRDTEPNRARAEHGRRDIAENLDVDAQRAEVAHQETPEPPPLRHQFNLCAIRRWIDEGFAKWTEQTGFAVPNGFAGEAAAAVWLHAQEIVKGAPARAAEWQPLTDLLSKWNHRIDMLREVIRLNVKNGPRCLNGSPARFAADISYEMAAVQTCADELEKLLPLGALAGDSNS